MFEDDTWQAAAIRARGRIRTRDQHEAWEQSANSYELSDSRRVVFRSCPSSFWLLLISPRLNLKLETAKPW